MKADFVKAVRKFIVPVISIGIGVPLAIIAAYTAGYELDHRKDPENCHAASPKPDTQCPKPR